MQISYTWALRRSLAYLHLSAASPPSSVAIGGNCVCVLSSLECNLYRLLVASLTVGLNIVPITEKFSVMSRESSRGNVSGYYRNLVPESGTRHHGMHRILYCLSACQYLHAMCILRDNWPVI